MSDCFGSVCFLPLLNLKCYTTHLSLHCFTSSHNFVKVYMSSFCVQQELNLHTALQSCQGHKPKWNICDSINLLWVGHGCICEYLPWGFTWSERTNLGSTASISHFSGWELVNSTHGHILIELVVETVLLWKMRCRVIQQLFSKNSDSGEI